MLAYKYRQSARSITRSVQHEPRQEICNLRIRRRAGWRIGSAGVIQAINLKDVGCDLRTAGRNNECQADSAERLVDPSATRCPIPCLRASGAGPFRPSVTDLPPSLAKAIEGEKRSKKKFKTYPIGFLHIDIADRSGGTARWLIPLTQEALVF
jgi:hypothetical protein